MLEEENAECGHCERLDQPVYDERDDQAFRLFTDALQAAEIHTDHHWPNHGPDQDRDRKIDIGVRQVCERREYLRDDEPQPDTRADGDCHPNGQVSFKRAHNGPSSLAAAGDPVSDFGDGCANFRVALAAVFHEVDHQVRHGVECCAIDDGSTVPCAGHQASMRQDVELGRQRIGRNVQ